MCCAVRRPVPARWGVARRTKNPTGLAVWFPHPDCHKARDESTSSCVAHAAREFLPGETPHLRKMLEKGRVMEKILVLALAYALLLSLLIFSTRKASLSPRRLAVLAMLTAFYVVLSLTLTVNLGWMKITLDSLPILLAALLYGPAGGVLVGLLGSFLNQLLTYGLMPTTILWILPAVVRGFVVGAYSEKHGKLPRSRLCLLLTASAVLVTALNTAVDYLDSVIVGYAYAAALARIATRVVSGIVTAVVMTFLVPPLLKLLHRVPEQVEKE